MGVETGVWHWIEDKDDAYTEWVLVFDAFYIEIPYVGQWHVFDGRIPDYYLRALNVESGWQKVRT